MRDQAQILIVDDEPITLNNLQLFLSKEGFAVCTANNGSEALELLKKHSFDVILTDLRMEKIDGLQLLQFCREIQPEAGVILITGFATVDTAVKAMKQGAFHYLTKPFKFHELLQAVKDAVAQSLPRRINKDLENKLLRTHDFGGIITQDPHMLTLLEKARDSACSDCSIMLSGESGTGKELVARYIHECSNRAQAPFLAINCGALTDGLLSNELFGHEKGSFTGANATQLGLLDAAESGTLFLDEVTEMSLAMQVKFLRVIQEHEFFRVGSTVPKKINVRFIAASNRNMSRMVECNEFRQDLFYRLNVVSLKLPRLQDRKKDIGLLSVHFLQKHVGAKGKMQPSAISEEVMEILANYSFPGNIRELENIIEQAVVMAKGPVIETAHLPEDMQLMQGSLLKEQEDVIPSLEDHEMNYIHWVLGKTNGNKTRAAALLGIDRASLWRKLKRHGL
ncbi:MAG: sigma-54-dependent Fis family transcriptional regulator [Magnetococcales bacterium]|nr:sigma-54-dependent Fis family transcriptional regulator [Magnetococcales bacterium]